MSPTGFFWCYVKTTLMLERKPLAFFLPATPIPMHTHSTGKGCISRQGTPLRTGHPRLRPAVTHCYSEMVTSGASLPFILEWTRACRGPFLSGVATTEEVSQRTAGGSARAKGPGRRKSEKKNKPKNATTTPGIPPQSDRKTAGTVRERPRVARCGTRTATTWSTQERQQISISRAKK